MFKSNKSGREAWRGFLKFLEDLLHNQALIVKEAFENPSGSSELIY